MASEDAHGLLPLFEFDERPAKVLRMEEENRLAMRANFRFPIAKYARAFCNELLAGGLDVVDLIADVMDAAFRVAFEELRDRGVSAERLQQLDFRIRQGDEDCRNPMVGLRHRFRNSRAQSVAINGCGCAAYLLTAIATWFRRPIMATSCTGLDNRNENRANRLLAPNELHFGADRPRDGIADEFAVLAPAAWECFRRRYRPRSSARSRHIEAVGIAGRKARHIDLRLGGDLAVSLHHDRHGNMTVPGQALALR